jgi:hypothetical protein
MSRAFAFRSWVHRRGVTRVLDVAANTAGRAASAGPTIGLGSNSAKKRQEGGMIAE